MHVLEMVSMLVVCFSMIVLLPGVTYHCICNYRHESRGFCNELGRSTSSLHAKRPLCDAAKLHTAKAITKSDFVPPRRQAKRRLPSSKDWIDYATLESPGGGL